MSRRNENVRKLILGSRGSKLAMTQSQWVASQLNSDIEIKKISTRGDKIHDVALAKIEGKGFFTKEIDDALLSKEIDLAVHSFKDVPTDLPEGLAIASVPSRESPNDALVGDYQSLEELPLNAKVGTASIRRRVEVLKARPDAKVLDLRGNLDTRIRKIKEGMYDAIIVAVAGLMRLGYSDYFPLDPTSFIPAAGQGALAITARSDDEEVLSELSEMEDPLTRLSVECERLFLSTLESGCQVPAGVYTTIDDKENKFSILGFISSLDGKQFISNEESGLVEDARTITLNVTKKLLDLGGSEILQKIREEGA
jgi:hydroxymethylbilane synthase